MDKYQVVIMSYKPFDKVIERFETSNSLRTAQRLQDGVDINLDHDNYYTEIIHIRE
tara:strand:- start:510 stop:677 length:168 start_codon:yes stop_codon:yes gene_type:complete